MSFRLKHFGRIEQAVSLVGTRQGQTELFFSLMSKAEKLHMGTSELIMQSTESQIISWKVGRMINI